MPATIRTYQTIGVIAQYINVEQFSSLSQQDKQFLQNLAANKLRYGSLTERQLYWFNKLISRARGEETQPDTPAHR